MKILTVLGARPQFIKASVLSKELDKICDEVILHTGQHYDTNMSEIFFAELGIKKPKYNLGIHESMHGAQTGLMLKGIEEIIVDEEPDAILVYGDTNSTLAGALAASKMNIPVLHVEAGLRSFNKKMPEEQNRILTDHISTWLFCPTQTAVSNCAREGIEFGVCNSGDVMLDSTLHFSQLALDKLNKNLTLGKYKTVANRYNLCTIHRAETTALGKEALKTIFDAFEQLDLKTIIPIHPRTRAMAEEVLEENNYSMISLVEPVGYLEMLFLCLHAKRIVTDSGGLQKEAFFLKKPCITLRKETEWVETVNRGWNVLTKLDTDEIVEKIKSSNPAGEPDLSIFGSGKACQNIAKVITQSFRNKM